MKKRLEKAFYWVCWKLVWIFYPKTTVEGTENLPEEPSIVVGNHSQANGPILAELYFPGKRAIWCAARRMLWCRTALWCCSACVKHAPKSRQKAELSRRILKFAVSHLPLRQKEGILKRAFEK